MENFEKEALQSASTPLGIGLGLWMTFLSSNNSHHKQFFLDHINNIDPAIRFTVEGNQKNGSISFLDTSVKPEADISLSITVYCNPTHTDHYLQWDSHHNLSAKWICHRYPHPQGQNHFHWSRTLPKGDTAVT